MIEKTKRVEIVMDILRPILASAVKNPNKVLYVVRCYSYAECAKDFGVSFGAHRR
jgi:hypothetical protein